MLAYIMKLLNDRYDYGLNLVLLSVDEGITGYRDDSLETVKRNKVTIENQFRSDDCFNVIVIVIWIL